MPRTSCRVDCSFLGQRPQGHLFAHGEHLLACFLFLCGVSHASVEANDAFPVQRDMVVGALESPNFLPNRGAFEFELKWIDERATGQCVFDGDRSICRLNLVADVAQISPGINVPGTIESKYVVFRSGETSWQYMPDEQLVMVDFITPETTERGFRYLPQESWLQFRELGPITAWLQGTQGPPIATMTANVSGDAVELTRTDGSGASILMRFAGDGSFRPLEYRGLATEQIPDPQFSGTYDWIEHEGRPWLRSAIHQHGSMKSDGPVASFRWTPCQESEVNLELPESGEKFLADIPSGTMVLDRTGDAGNTSYYLHGEDGRSDFLMRLLQSDFHEKSR